ncbi:hypothetical protein GPECTOR_53g104 [Gonium pectorale]|uniref:Uncharacterized protein n=1 Tax=Gonium pectorale TaxID=33097 RepID=A0A150G6Q9_GONPE|nr:hypothetical protein GPECTOR_53g104 [Gonium pectorale]|eukprot:KXZ45518.1 hypothetical protein GPECTOR_53g104 [Gonium pectorale]
MIMRPPGEAAFSQQPPPPPPRRDGGMAGAQFDMPPVRDTREGREWEEAGGGGRLPYGPMISARGGRDRGGRFSDDRSLEQDIPMPPPFAPDPSSTYLDGGGRSSPPPPPPLRGAGRSGGGNTAGFIMPPIMDGGGGGGAMASAQAGAGAPMGGAGGPMGHSQQPHQSDAMGHIMPPIMDGGGANQAGRRGQGAVARGGGELEQQQLFLQQQQQQMAMHLGGGGGAGTGPAAGAQQQAGRIVDPVLQMRKRREYARQRLQLQAVMACPQVVGQEAYAELEKAYKRLATEAAALPQEQRPSVAADPRAPVMGTPRVSAASAASARLRSFALSELLLDDSYWSSAQMASALAAAAAMAGGPAGGHGSALGLGSERHLASHRRNLQACRQLQAEASGLLEQWARAVLLLAANVNGVPLRIDWAGVFLMTLGVPSSPAGDLRGRPCLSYLVSCHMVQLCAALDGGPTYGLPDAGEGPGAAPKLVTESAEMDSYLAQCGLEMWEYTIRGAREGPGAINAAAAPAIDGACLAGGAVCAVDLAPPGALSRLGRLWELRLAAAERAQLVEDGQSWTGGCGRRWNTWDFEPVILHLELPRSADTGLAQLPVAPSLDVAAALGAGYVARIERMMRRCRPEVMTSLRLPTDCDPVAWDQVLAFGPARETLSLLATAAKKVRKDTAKPSARYKASMRYAVTISLLGWLPLLAAARATLPWASSLLSGPEWGLVELLGCTLGQALLLGMDSGNAIHGLLPTLAEALRALVHLAPEQLVSALPGAVAFPVGFNPLPQRFMVILRPDLPADLAEWVAAAALLLPPADLAPLLPCCANPRCTNLGGPSGREMQLLVHSGADGVAVAGGGEQCYCSRGCAEEHRWAGPGL